MAAAAAQAAQAALHAGRSAAAQQQQLRYAAHEQAMMQGYVPPGPELRYENPPMPSSSQGMGMSSMQQRDLYAMQQHLAMNPSGPPHVQAAPAQAQPNGVYPIGLGRPPSQQAMRSAPMPQGGLPGRVPVPSMPYYPTGAAPVPSYNPGGQPQPMMMPGQQHPQHTQQQQYAAAQAQAQAQMQGQPHPSLTPQMSGPSPSMQSPGVFAGQPPVAGPSRLAAPRPPMAGRQLSAQNVRVQPPPQQQPQPSVLPPQQQQPGAPQPQPRPPGAAAASAGPPRPQHGPPSIQPSNSGVAMMRLLQYSDLLSSAMRQGTLEALQDFVADYYTEDAQVIYQLYDPITDQNKHFQIPACAIPRYLLTLAESGVRGHLLCFNSPKEFAHLSGNVLLGYQVECPHVTYITHFSNGTQVSSTGQQRVRFARVSRPVPPGMPPGEAPMMLKLEQVEHILVKHAQSIMRDSIMIEEELRPLTNSSGQDPTSPSHTMDGAGSAGSLSDKGKGSNPPSAKRRRTGTMNSVKGEINGDISMPDLQAEGFDENKPGTGSSIASKAAGAFLRTILPDALTGPFGLTDRSLRCLEIAESVAKLQSLIIFSQQHELSPIEALHQFTENIASRSEEARRFLAGEEQMMHSEPSPMMVSATPAGLPPGTPAPLPPSSVHANSPRSPALSGGLQRRKTAGADAKSPDAHDADEAKTSPINGRTRTRRSQM